MSSDEVQLNVAGQLIRELAKARQSGSLYPTGHPQRMELGHGLLEHARSLRRRAPGDPTLFIDRGGFYLGGILLPRESLAQGKLAEHLHEVGIESLTFGEGLTAEDFDGLLGVLAGQRDHEGGFGSLRINAVRPAFRHEEPWEERLIELRRAYAGGVTLLRDTSTAMAAGESVDLDGALATVRHLHAQVEHDPVTACCSAR